MPLLAKSFCLLPLLLTVAIAAAQEAEPFPFTNHGPGISTPRLNKEAGPRPDSITAAHSQPLDPGAHRTPVELSPPIGEKRLPLARPTAGDGGRAKAGPSMVTLLGSLAMVLGLFFLVTWIMRKGVGQGPQALPRDAFEVLGRAPLAGRQQAHLIRCGNKLLLISLTAGGADTLTEITDPAEVDRLTAVCRKERPQAAATAFRQIFSQFAPDRVSVGAAAKLKRLTPQSPLAALEDDDDV